MDNTQRFTGKGELYAAARPQYAPRLFDWLNDTLHISENSVFADVGSGTGIFTEQLLNCGWRVYAVEPNEDMRRIAEQKLKDRQRFVSVFGTDKATGLSDRSVDYVTAAQAFHWFDAEAFRLECRRILKTGGKVILVYNTRNENADCTKALAEIRRKYNPDFHGFSNGISDEKCLSFFDGGCEVFFTDNSQRYDRQEYIKRVLSSSYSLREADACYAAYFEDVHSVFDRFAENGILTVPIYTIAYAGSL